jgi:hypothetical protein
MNRKHFLISSAMTFVLPGELLAASKKSKIQEGQHYDLTAV